MKANIMNSGNLVIFPTLLLTSFLPVAFAAPKADPAAQLLPAQLLKDMQLRADSAASNADQLWALITMTPHTADSQLEGLGALREAVNAMGHDATKLDAERDKLSPLEQQALDRVLPLLQAEASDTSGAIESFNNDRSRELPNSAEIRYADDLRVRSEKIASTLRTFLTMERLHQKESAAEAAISGAGN
jgi:hypothetical protein